ncbi:O-methyltransferase family protein, partial [Reticulomyxa filosa]
MSLVKLTTRFVAGAGARVTFLRHSKNSQWIKRGFVGLTTEGNVKNGTIGTDIKITDAGLRDYLNQKGNREIKAFEEITKETEKRFPKEAMMVTDLAQLYFFRWLISTLNVKKAIEVGVFTGSSSLAIANGLPKDGKLIAIDISDEYTKVARDFWKKEGVNGKVDLRIELTNNNSEIGTFDFAFID